MVQNCVGFHAAQNLDLGLWDITLMECMHTILIDIFTSMAPCMEELAPCIEEQGQYDTMRNSCKSIPSSAPSEQIRWNALDVYILAATNGGQFEQIPQLSFHSSENREGPIIQVFRQSSLPCHFHNEGTQPDFCLRSVGCCFQDLHTCGHSVLVCSQSRKFL